jgi:hypothetical protein
VKPSTPFPVAAFDTNATSPEGFAVPEPGVTVTLTVTLCPAVIPVRGESVKVVEVDVNVARAVLQLVTRLFAFIEPSPVAKS